MPCMCGDPYCWSCGPAQGNYQCEACGIGSADGGCKDPVWCELEGALMALQEAAYDPMSQDTANDVIAAIRNQEHHLEKYESSRWWRLAYRIHFWGQNQRRKLRLALGWKW